jgi:hypothetical protein
VTRASETDSDALRVCCECGRWLPIEPSAAGSAVTCSCGCRVVVPLLEEFRRRRDLLSAATIERRVRRLIAAAELPPPGGCARCGRLDTLEVVPLQLECERYTARAYGGERFLIIPLFSLLVWVRWREEERLEIRGRDTDVQAPVRLCEACTSYFRGRSGWVYHGLAALVIALGGLAALVMALAGLAAYLDLAVGLGVAVAGVLGLAMWRRVAFWSRQRQLKRLLRQVPAYRQILARYRHAAVVVPSEAPTWNRPEE